MKPMHITPVVSEKAMASVESGRTYVFTVPFDASKVSIKEEIAQRFKVNVEEVNTARIKGKPKNALVKRGRRQIPGRRSDIKKAYVKLASGQSIELFEEPKTAKQSKKTDKKDSK